MTFWWLNCRNWTYWSRAGGWKNIDEYTLLSAINRTLLWLLNWSSRWLTDWSWPGQGLLDLLWPYNSLRLLLSWLYERLLLRRGDDGSDLSDLLRWSGHCGRARVNIAALNTHFGTLKENVRHGTRRNESESNLGWRLEQGLDQVTKGLIVSLLLIIYYGLFINFTWGRVLWVSSK